METVQRNAVVKKVAAIVMGAAVVIAVCALGLYFREAQQDARAVNVKFVQLDKAQQTLSNLANKNPAALTTNDIKTFQNSMKQVPAGLYTQRGAAAIKAFENFVTGRGNPNSLDAKWKAIRSTAQKGLDYFKQEGFKSANEMADINTMFNSSKIESGPDAFSSDVRGKLSVLINRFSKVTMDEQKREQALAILNQIESTFGEIEARSQFHRSHAGDVAAFAALIRNNMSALADYSSILAAAGRLAHEQMKDIAYYAFGLALTMAAMFFTMQFRREKTVIKEVVREVPAAVTATEPAQDTFSSVINNFFQSYMDVATIVLNGKDEVIWASDSFYQLAGNLDKNRNYNWNDLLRSEIVVMGGVSHIKGAVKIKSRPSENYQMKSKTLVGGAAQLKDARIIQFIPLLSYQSEINKELMQYDSFKGVARPKLYELGDLIEESAKKMTAKFGKNNLVFAQSNPIYVAVEREEFVQAMDTVLTGLLLFGENTFNSGNVSVTQDREGETNTIVFSYQQTKFDNVTAPLGLRGKTYPSLSAYLAKFEEQLTKYHAEVNLKNIYHKNGTIQEGRLEVRFREPAEVIQEAASLPQRERVARAVEAAKRVQSNNEKVVVANAPAAKKAPTDKRYSVKEFN